MDQNFEKTGEKDKMKFWKESGEIGKKTILLQVNELGIIYHKFSQKTNSEFSNDIQPLICLINNQYHYN